MWYAEANPQNVKSFYPLESSAPTSSSIPSSSLHRSAKAFATILRLERGLRNSPRKTRRLNHPTSPFPRTDTSSFADPSSSQNYKDLRLLITRVFHDHQLSGHPGVTKTLQAIRRRYWWPQITVYVKDYIASCPECRRSTDYPAQALRSSPLPPHSRTSLELALYGLH